MAAIDAPSATTPPQGPIARLRSMLGRLLGGSNEASLTRRLAGTIFIIRVFSAALAYFSQVLLARETPLRGIEVKPGEPQVLDFPIGSDKK